MTVFQRIETEKNRFKNVSVGVGRVDFQESLRTPGEEGVITREVRVRNEQDEVTGVVVLQTGF